ncbi:MAG: DUF465 domain-containing protein [Alphaproteobacteria bacterium]|nr:DUF465 domain-containing protein [Alphaproteobacteria bacterium]
MALEDRIEALKKKHADLDRQLREESSRVSVDQLAIGRLKALKLGIKDEIERLMKDKQAVA